MAGAAWAGATGVIGAGVAGACGCGACGGGGTRAGAATGGGAGAGGGGVAQPASSNSPVASQKWEIRMEWILLEAAVALGLGIFIAWWLLHGKNKPPRDTERGE